MIVPRDLFPIFRTPRILRLFQAGLLLGLASVGPLRAADPPKLTPQETEFFEKKIRPLLTENCYKCHSKQAKKVRGGLLLDTRDGVLKGGDDGEIIVPGNPDKSALIIAVRYTDKDRQMPPDEQLQASQISDLEAWVKMGAPDPRTGADAGGQYLADPDKASKHWAFQPVAHPSVPEPDDPQHWAQTPVDKFVLATLATKGLTPSPRADKVTLIRRATFDLIGLPPTPKEVEDFVADDSTNAFATVVDRLLASPHYGERWGRHWLDIAHFADTRSIGNNRDDIYPYAYTYRDWVIRAFNEDLPYDQFIIQQIAADKLPLSDDKRPLAAMGFLTLGNRFNNQPNDIIDDRIDIVAKGTMAMTMTCARCHDHKFDPIPTTDYYALHGVFNSSMEPKEEPLLETPKDTPAYREFCREYASREEALKSFRDENSKLLKAEMIGKSWSYMLAVRQYNLDGTNVARNVYMTKLGLNPQIAAVWDNNLKNLARRHNPIFAPWFEFAALRDDEFAAKTKEISARIYANNEKGKPVNPLVARMFSSAPDSLNQVATRYSSVFSDVEQRWRETQAGYEAKKSSPDAPPEPKGLADAGQEQIRQFMYAPNSPMLLNDQRLNNFLNRDNKLRNKQNELEKSVNDLIVNHPGSPARAMVLEDMDKPRDSYVFIKGNPGNRGPNATRHFLTILSGGNPSEFKEGSGRLELAKDIASKENPLTARVMVNRIWLNHFGEGLVRTPDDFGTRGDTPSHPELLDYLASRFMDGGWSIKQMHRLIMLSSVYQQSSDENPRYELTDPENRWLWRMNRQKLDFEALRDTILAIGGDLDPTMGGKSVKLDAEPYSLRRTVYGFVDRRNVPNMYQAFDFASPDLTTGKRETVVVPQQALFMMNSPLVVEQARNVVRRTDFKSQAGPQARIEMLYELIYQRAPTEMEMKLALDYLRSDATTEWDTNPQDVWEYGFGEYDPATKRTKNFAVLRNFANKAWQPGGKTPDARLRGLSLNAEGGMPAKDFAVVRRWIAPRDGFISIDGTLAHNNKDGDGVQGTIFSSRLGVLGSWVAYNQTTPTKMPRVFIKRGETIDFIVDCRENPRNDAFKWAPVIKMERAPGTAVDAIVEWDARRDFTGDTRVRRLNSWEKFAQVLLETNELTYIN